MVPEVYTMCAMSSGDGPARAVPGWMFAAESLTSMIGSVYPSRRERSAALVIAAIGRASLIMNSMRESGTAGAIGRYAAPLLSTDRIATIASPRRSESNATH